MERTLLQKPTKKGFLLGNSDQGRTSSLIGKKFGTPLCLEEPSPQEAPGMIQNEDLDKSLTKVTSRGSLEPRGGG